ncbi:MAG: hypothetical protein HY270_14795 [Deltaproteobacteria bacterium]|nr:hypothetical protein [Deltaproteobacteria bacterium]
MCGTTPTPTPMLDGNGRPVFLTANAGGFLLVLEARPGTNGASVGTSVPPPTPGQGVRPDLQIQASSALGNGSATICDTQRIVDGGGGVPGFDPPDFSSLSSITDALIDFACRFDPHSPSVPCTLSGDGNDGTITANLPIGSEQFCYRTEINTAFPYGDTVLTAQVRDSSAAHNIGPTAQIVIRRVTPHP